jgi:hypothetical protein
MNISNTSAVMPGQKNAMAADRQEHVNLIWRLASRVRVGILLDDGLAHPAKAEDGGKLVVE